MALERIEAQLMQMAGSAQTRGCLVTKAQIDRLSQRIDLVTERLGAAKRPTYGV